MYGYEDTKDLSVEYILNHVNQIEVAESILGIKVLFEGYIKNPFREDNNAGAFFTWYGDTLKLVDFADSKRVRDIIDFVGETRNLNFKSSLRYIYDHFIKGKPEAFVAIKKETREEIDQDIEKRWPFTFGFREFEYRDRQFWWDRYDISRQNLINDYIAPIHWYQFFSKKRGREFSIATPDLCYAFLGWGEGIAKIYRPFSFKSIGKWITNCSADMVGNLSNISERGKKLIITKSYKDCRVLLNQGIKDVIWFQSEGIYPNDSILLNLLSRYESIVILFDNDAAGIKYSQKLKYHLNSLLPCKVVLVYVPLYLLSKGVKDPSDFYYYSKTLRNQGFNQFIKEL